MPRILPEIQPPRRAPFRSTLLFALTVGAYWNTPEDHDYDFRSNYSRGIASPAAPLVRVGSPLHPHCGRIRPVSRGVRSPGPLLLHRLVVVYHTGGCLGLEASRTFPFA